MASFPKTAYRRHLVINAESVDKTTNPYYKNTCAHMLQKMKQIFFWSNIIFQYASVSLCLNKITKI